MASLPPAAPLEDVSNCTSPEKKRARSGASITDDGARDCPICLEPWVRRDWKTFCFFEALLFFFALA